MESVLLQADYILLIYSPAQGSHLNAYLPIRGGKMEKSLYARGRAERSF